MKKGLSMAEKTMQVKIKNASIIKMLAVTALVISIMVVIYIVYKSLPSYESLKDSSWILADLVHSPQFVIPFLPICYITKGRVGEYGFNSREDPPLFTHRRMLRIGILFGLLMSLRYVPQIVGNAPLDIPKPVTLVDVLGNMTFQWVVVGVCEETYV
jgi:hypothetical protein